MHLLHCRVSLKLVKLSFYLTKSDHTVSTSSTMSYPNLCSLQLPWSRMTWPYAEPMPCDIYHSNLVPVTPSKWKYNTAEQVPLDNVIHKIVQTKWYKKIKSKMEVYTQQIHWTFESQITRNNQDYQRNTIWKEYSELHETKTQTPRN